MKRLFLKIYQNKKIAVGLALIFTAIILIACLLPSKKIPKVDVPMMDKWVHFLAFGVFAFAWATTLKRVNFIALLKIVICSALLGWAIELLQISGLTKGRSYENMDIVADTIGGIIGVVMFGIYYRLIGKPKV